jgi:hypothetical protein
LNHCLDNQWFRNSGLGLDRLKNLPPIVSALISYLDPNRRQICPLIWCFPHFCPFFQNKKFLALFFKIDRFLGDILTLTIKTLGENNAIIRKEEQSKESKARRKNRKAISPFPVFPFQPHLAFQVKGSFTLLSTFIVWFP